MAGSMNVTSKGYQPQMAPVAPFAASAAPKTPASASTAQAPPNPLQPHLPSSPYSPYSPYSPSSFSGVNGAINRLNPLPDASLRALAGNQPRTVGGVAIRGEPSRLETVTGNSRSTGKMLQGELMFGRSATGSPMFWLKGADTNYLLRGADGKLVTNPQAARERAHNLISGGGAARLRSIDAAPGTTEVRGMTSKDNKISIDLEDPAINNMGRTGRSGFAFGTGEKGSALTSNDAVQAARKMGLPVNVSNDNPKLSPRNASLRAVVELSDDAIGGRQYANATAHPGGFTIGVPTYQVPAQSSAEFKKGYADASSEIMTAKVRASTDNVAAGVAGMGPSRTGVSVTPRPATTTLVRPRTGTGTADQTTALQGTSAPQSRMPSSPLVVPRIDNPKPGTTVGAAPPARNPPALRLNTAESAVAAVLHPAAEGRFVVGKQDGVVVSGRWDPAPAGQAPGSGRYTKTQVDSLAREVSKVPEAARTSVTGTVKKMLEDNTSLSVIQYYLRSHVRGWEPAYHYAALFKIHTAIKNKAADFAPLSIGDVARLNADIRKIVAVDTALKGSVHANALSPGYTSFVNSIKTSSHDVKSGLEIMQVAEKILSGRYPDPARAMKLFNDLVKTPNAETPRTLTRALEVLTPDAYESFAQYSIHRAKKSPDRDQVGDFIGTNMIGDLVKTATAKDPSKSALLQNYTGYFDQKKSVRFTPGEFATMSSKMHVYRADEVSQAGDSAKGYLGRQGSVTIALDGNYIAVGSTSKHDLRRFGPADCTVQISDQGSMMVDRYAITSLDTRSRPVYVKLPGQTDSISVAELGARQSPQREGMNPVTPEEAARGGHHFTATVPEGTQVWIRNYSGTPDIVFTLPN